MEKIINMLQPSKNIEQQKSDATYVDDDFHRFGCMWDETGYTFFVDGVQSGRKLTESVSHIPQFILLRAEVFRGRNEIPGIYKDDKNLKVVENDKFIVDYVRVFDKNN